MDLDEIRNKLEQAFHEEDVKTVVLDSEWLKRNKELGIDSTGFCYSASEVIYRLDGGKEKWKKVAISRKSWSLGGHCYLINKQTGDKLDITADQYTKRGIEIPYDKGKGGGFRTKNFSKRAWQLATKSGLVNDNEL